MTAEVNKMYALNVRSICKEHGVTSSRQTILDATESDNIYVLLENTQRKLSQNRYVDPCSNCLNRRVVINMIRYEPGVSQKDINDLYSGDHVFDIIPIVERETDAKVDPEAEAEANHYNGVVVWMRNGSRFEFDNGRSWVRNSEVISVYGKTKDGVLIASFKTDDVLAVFNPNSSGYKSEKGIIESLG